jgi:hypothetical protein
MKWFLENRRDLARHILYSKDVCPETSSSSSGYWLLAIPPRDRLERVLKRLLDTNEFLSPYGIRSLSRIHAQKPFVIELDGSRQEVRYEPGEGESGMFGGNSNWRGPIWFPLNYLLIEALERYGHFYADHLRVEFPTGSGQMLNLKQVADELSRRMASIFVPRGDALGGVSAGEAPERSQGVGSRCCAWQGNDQRFAQDEHWKHLTLFHEYFHGDTGRGLGATHQTGWTALVTQFLADVNRTGID